MKNILLAILLLFFSFQIFSQKKPIDHTAYKQWKRISDPKISKSGKYLTYEILPYEGDGFLYVYNNITEKLDSFSRGKQAVIFDDDSFLIYKKTPTFDTIRKEELKKVKADKKAKDSLMIYDFSTQKLQNIDHVKNFDVVSDKKWIVYTAEDNDLKLIQKKKWIFFKEKTTPYTSTGKRTVIYSPSENLKYSEKDVVSYKLSDKNHYVALVKHKKEKSDSNYLNIYSIAKKESFEIPTSFTAVSKLTFHDETNQLFFIASNDTLKKHAYALYQIDVPNKTLSKKISINDSLLGSKMSISENAELYLTKDADVIYFGIAPTPTKAPKDTLLEKEKAKLDIWIWNDNVSQTRKIADKSNLEKDSYLTKMNLKTGAIFVIESDSIRVRFDKRKVNQDFMLASNSMKYENSIDWDYPGYNDFLLVDLKNDKIDTLKNKVQFSVNLSPDGRQFVYFDTKELNYKALDIERKKEICLTCSVKENWQIDFNGMPSIADPYGIIDWTKDSKKVIIDSEFEPYIYDFENKQLARLTGNFGKNNNVRIELEKYHSDSLFFDDTNYYATAFYLNDKSKAIFSIKFDGTQLVLDTLIHSDHTIDLLFKNDSTNTFFYRKGNVNQYPEVYSLKGGIEKKISTTNPQQDQYNWATVELLKWKSYKGIELEGLLYKPENYDSTKSYPMIVYFYEMNSDNLHQHSTPRPTASIVFPTEYASSGYFVLIPDIRYEPGYPARGAYDCIMSATDAALKKYPSIDSLRLGLQGQSWGGYQTAQLITMTERYKAAMAGAPVSNMFSAYGGIRWSSGLTRQFQYEKTQSRIGKTIWEAPELYVENSPLFHIPKIKTPLLIMANDDDGAVPWYQGIEMFAGMRRLQKPVWLLNYNGDGHNLMKPANRLDLSIRMKQFFDYYLMNQPMPRWMKESISPLDKGKEYYLDLLKEE